MANPRPPRLRRRLPLFRRFLETHPPLPFSSSPTARKGEHPTDSRRPGLLLGLPLPELAMRQPGDEARVAQPRQHTPAARHLCRRVCVLLRGAQPPGASRGLHPRLARANQVGSAGPLADLRRNQARRGTCGDDRGQLLPLRCGRQGGAPSLPLRPQVCRQGPRVGLGLLRARLFRGRSLFPAGGEAEARLSVDHRGAGGLRLVIPRGSKRNVGVERRGEGLEEVGHVPARRGAAGSAPQR